MVAILVVVSETESASSCHSAVTYRSSLPQSLSVKLHNFLPVNVCERPLPPEQLINSLYIATATVMHSVQLLDFLSR